MASEQPGVEVASPFRRFGGALCDGLVFLLVSFVVLNAADGDLREPGWRAANTMAVALYAIVGVAVWGRTIGKKVVGTRVVDRLTNGTPGWGAAVVRWLVPTAPFFVAEVFEGAVPLLAEAVGIAVYAPILWDPLHRGLHDRLAGTLVVDD